MRVRKVSPQTTSGANRSAEVQKLGSRHRAEPSGDDEEQLMKPIQHMHPTWLPAALPQRLERVLLRRCARLPLPIRTTATGRYLQRLQWLFGGG